MKYAKNMNQQPKHQNIKTSSLVTAILYILPIVLFLYLTLYDINPSGKRYILYQVQQPSPVISALFPAHRLSGIAQGMQQVKFEPVYFTVRYPHQYETAAIRIRVDNPDALEWNIGLEVNALSGWSYDLVKPDPQGLALFQLHRAQVRDRKIRFMVSVNDLNGKQFSIKNVSVLLQRTPLWQRFRIIDT